MFILKDHSQQATQWLMQILTSNTGCPSVPQPWDFLRCETNMAQTGTVPERWDSWLFETHDSSWKDKVMFPSRIGSDAGTSVQTDMEPSFIVYYILCDTDRSKCRDVHTRGRMSIGAKKQCSEWPLKLSLEIGSFTFSKEPSSIPYSFLHSQSDHHCRASGAESFVES